MSFRKVVQTAGVVAAVCVLAATVTDAMTAKRSTYFTFRTPVGLPGVVLPPGTYVFEIANPDSSADVVQVLDRGRTKVYLTALTLSVAREPKGRLDATVVFGEVSKSSPRQINAWYAAGHSTGREFLR